MLNIETWKTNLILRAVSEKIKQSEIKKYGKLAKEMIKYIKNPDNWWVWLAAPQVWVNKRLIIVSLLKDREDEDFQTIIMFNPTILEKWKELYFDQEGCLSVPWEKWEVERYNKIKVHFLDIKWKEKKLILKGLSSRIVQHEIDHLDGILFTDKLKKAF